VCQPFQIMESQPEEPSKEVNTGRFDRNGFLAAHQESNEARQTKRGPACVPSLYFSGDRLVLEVGRTHMPSEGRGILSRIVLI
jgi:hypothetical protein